KATGQPQRAQVPPVPRDGPRLGAAVSTALAGDLDAAMQLGRLAGNEPLDAANDAFADGMRRDKRVKGWVRGLDSDPCELCVWWWREGRIWQPDHTMPRHVGCVCSP